MDRWETMTVRQVLIVTLKGGVKKYYTSSSPSTIYDFRNEIEMKKGVVDTEMQYDVGQFKGKTIKYIKARN